MRKLRLREEALALWRVTPDYPRARVRQEVKQLKAGIAALLAEIHGATP